MGALRWNISLSGEIPRTQCHPVPGWLATDCLFKNSGAATKIDLCVIGRRVRKRNAWRAVTFRRVRVDARAAVMLHGAANTLTLMFADLLVVLNPLSNDMALTSP